MPQIYSRSRRIVQRHVNPLLLPPEPTPEPTPEPEPVPSTDMSLAELRALADAKGVASYGSKADIIERLG